jgi:prefoldin subunit 5
MKRCSLDCLFESLQSQINQLNLNILKLQSEVVVLQNKVGGTTITIDNLEATTVTTETLVLTGSQ